MSELSRRTVAQARIALERLAHHRQNLVRPGDVRSHRGEGSRRLREAHDQQCPRRRGGEGQISGEHVEGDEGERVQVAAPVELFAGKLLGAHVLRRPNDDAGPRHALRSLSGRLGDAEVHDLHDVDPIAVGADHDVVGLKIAMHDPHGMRGV